MDAVARLIVAGIDVHKRMLAVVLVDADDPQRPLAEAKFGTTVDDTDEMTAWLQAKGAGVAVMESTAQYWKPVWLALEEAGIEVHLAQAQSNAAPRGRKGDFRDAARLARRFLAAELKLSCVPDREQRQWRCLARSKHQLRRDRVTLQNELEALLEEGRIKLSSVITDLLGTTGRRILAALAKGESDAQKLAEMADPGVKASRERLAAALKGRLDPAHRTVLKLKLEHLALLDVQIEELRLELRKALDAHQEAVNRLCEIPGIKEDCAMQMIAEIGPEAAVFESPANLASWIGVCPGREESAGESRSDRSPKGNPTMRRLLNQAAWGAVHTKGSHYQDKYNALRPRLGTNKALWAIAHKLSTVVWIVLHRKEKYIEKGPRKLNLKTARRRVTNLSKQLAALGYSLQLKPISAA